jgi:hypothetical protein
LDRQEKLPSARPSKHEAELLFYNRNLIDRRFAAGCAMQKVVPKTPNGYHTVTPYLTVAGAQAFVVFLETVFGGQVSERILRPDGKIAHADVRIGDSTIMLSDATEDWPSMPAAIYLYVERADATYSRGGWLQEPN